MPPAAFIDPAAFVDVHAVYDRDVIRLANPQRFEMEQLTAVVHLDREAGLVVGYKDVAADEFWARRSSSGPPLMPHVLVCEAAAQLCSFYCHEVGAVPGGYLLFGGMERVRFRGAIGPGDRLIIAGKKEKVRRRQTTFAAQAFVGPVMVFHGSVIGVPFIP